MLIIVNYLTLVVKSSSFSRKRVFGRLRCMIISQARERSWSAIKSMTFIEKKLENFSTLTMISFVIGSQMTDLMIVTTQLQ